MKNAISEKLYRVYFRFIQFSLGLYSGEEFLSGDVLVNFDWNAFYRFDKRQTLVGVVFDGIQRLPKKAAPDQDLLMTWFGQSQRIHKRNILMNEATAQIYNKIRAEGFRCCILKGQGNALMYPNPESRTPGDVDVWVNASREEIRRLAKRLVSDDSTIGEESLNHIEMTLNGIAVELHSSPAILNNPLYNHRLQKWLGRNIDLQCSNIVSLPDETGNIAVPTCAFNLIYQLFHLYHHYFYEGIGLRQIVDYYFVIDKWHTDLTDSTDISRRMDNRYHTDLVSPSVADLQFTDSELNSKKQYAVRKAKSVESVRSVCEKELKCLGLWKFAGAVMYVLHEVLGLSEDRMIRPMAEKRGRMLLEEILVGGNFGQHDGRYGFGHGAIGHNLQRLCRDGRLVRYYPAEALSEPIFRMWHFFWRKFHQ